MFRSQLSCVLTVCLLLLPNVETRARQNDKAPIEYTVNFDQHNLNYLIVKAAIEPTGDTTELMMPVWTPGSYLVREFARHIDSFRANDKDNQPLVWRKIKKNRWEIESKETQKIEIAYRTVLQRSFSQNEFCRW